MVEVKEINYSGGDTELESLPRIDHSKETANPRYVFEDVSLQEPDYTGNLSSTSSHSIIRLTDKSSLDTESAEPFYSTGLDKWQFFVLWYGLAALSHLAKGGHNAFASYLNTDKQKKPPEFSLLAFGNLLVLLCYTPRIIYKVMQTIRTRHANWQSTTVTEPQEQQEEQLTLQRHGSMRILWNSGRSFLTHPALYIFLTSIMVRALVRSQALGFTTAVLLQLVELQAPFIITFVSVYVFKRGALRWQTVLTLVATLVGSVALILGESTNQESGFHWMPNFSNTAANFGVNHLIGLSLAFISAFTLASRTLTVDYITVHEHMKLSCENMFIAEKLVLCTVLLALSLVFGDYSQFGAMGWKQWSIFLLTSFVNEFIGSFLSIYGTAKLGSTTYGILLPIRLFSTIFIAMILLGETINNFLEILGIVVITVSLIAYMSWNRYATSHKRLLDTPSFSNSSRYRMEPFSNLKIDG